MSKRKAIGILGGTFDPVHNGHLRLALEVRSSFELEEIRLIPLRIPPHRKPPVASDTQRLAMLKLATEDCDFLTVDERELNRPDISYSIDTLQSLRKDYPNSALSLIVGEDAFQHIDSWKDWQQLLDFSHIIIASRPDSESGEYSSAVRNYITKHRAKRGEDIRNRLHGLIDECPIPPLDISSTQIRSKLASRKSCRYLLPDSVLDYIQSEKLYGS